MKTPTGSPEIVLPSARIRSLDEYALRGGLVGLQRARSIGPDAVIAEISASGLRGRGGAGFPAGTKWRSVRDAGAPTFVVVNGAEGEPGTFKDRAIMRSDPFQVVEGALIAAFAVGADAVVVATKAKYALERRAMARAINEFVAAGLTQVPVDLFAGPDSYLFGEEKALLEAIEGNEPMPRILPPFQYGLFAGGAQLGWSARESRGDGDNPTVVNNVETMANVPHILANGADWYRSFGTPDSPGTVVCTVVGDVVSPVVVELEMGTPLDVALRRAGGVRAGRAVKAVLNGVANAVLGPEHLDIGLDHRSLDAVGSGLGAAGFAVYDEDARMMSVAASVAEFLAVGSCGQCLPCKVGGTHVAETLRSLAVGSVDPTELNQLCLRLQQLPDGSRCYLPTQHQKVVTSILQRFTDDLELHLAGVGCGRQERGVPRLRTVGNGHAVLERVRSGVAPGRR